MQAQLVLLPGRSWKRHRPAELAPRLRSVEAQEVDRLANLENGVRQSLAAFADAQREQLLAMLLEQVGGAVEQPGAGLATQRVPLGLSGRSRAHHPLDVLGAGFGHRADLDPAVV